MKQDNQDVYIHLYHKTSQSALKGLVKTIGILPVNDLVRRALAWNISSYKDGCF